MWKTPLTILLIIVVVSIIVWVVLYQYTQRKREQTQTIKCKVLIATVHIVVLSILIATGATVVLHCIYTVLKQRVTTISVFSEAETVNICICIFTAVTAIMIYKKQTESAALSAQEEKTREDIYKNTVQQFYGACLTMEVQTKISDALQKTADTWQTNSIQQLCLQKSVDSGAYNICLTLSNVVRTQNVLNIDGASCEVQRISDTKLVKITVNCKNDAVITTDGLDHKLVIPLNAETDVLTQTPQFLFETFCTCVHKHEAMEMQICFKNVQHKYLQKPQLPDGECQSLDTLIAGMRNDTLHYNADICITLDDGALGTNVVQFDECQTWCAYTALPTDETNENSPIHE